MIKTVFKNVSRNESEIPQMTENGSSVEVEIGLELGLRLGLLWVRYGDPLTITLNLTLTLTLILTLILTQSLTPRDYSLRMTMCVGDCYPYRMVLLLMLTA
jgi:hypothetical protein